MAFGQGGDRRHPDRAGRCLRHLRQRWHPLPPQVAAAIVSPNGKLVKTVRSEGHRTVSLPPAVEQPILQGLLGVVDRPEGTAYEPSSRTPTSRCQRSGSPARPAPPTSGAGQEPDAWFVGFGPRRPGPPRVRGGGRRWARAATAPRLRPQRSPTSSTTSTRTPWARWSCPRDPRYLRPRRPRRWRRRAPATSTTTAGALGLPDRESR